MPGEFKIFYGEPLDDYVARRVEGLKSKVHGETASYLLNVDETVYIAHLVDTFEIDPLVIHFDQISASSREEMIPAHRFPRDFNVYEGKSYVRPVVTFHIPVTGETQLLHLRPSAFVMMTHAVRLMDGCICFDVIDFRSDHEELKRECDRVVQTIRAQAVNVQSQVAAFNTALPHIAKTLLAERQNTLAQRSDTLAKLGVPIRKSTSLPTTFAVPTVRKKIATKPVVPTQTTAPVPTLEPALYEDILRVIHDMGKVFERLPSTYAGKDEETLRDHLIMQLEPRFEGATTGETFNKNGKTDILIRYQGTNVFVAECKFWGGRVKHLETISQLLSYLTWRDSKTALIYFVNRKEIMPVLDEIGKSTPTHPQFSKVVARRDDSWTQFEMALPGDNDCKIQMAVLAFHIPV